jgi:hypothetical protein
MDGFLSFPASALEFGSSLNIEPYRNEYSPFSRMQGIDPVQSAEQVLVDSYYGLAYDSWINIGGNPYGITSELPTGPLDGLAKDYLRVPFARVPRINVREKDQLFRMLQKIREFYPGLTLLFRGQNREYLLNRSAETLEKLYGSKVCEPSLLPSAERRGLNIDMVGPTWCGVLRYFLDVWATAKRNDEQFRYIHRFGEHYLFHHFALAIAQHYGLPSSGLDVTNSIETALFFALHRFSRSQQNPSSMVCSRLGDRNEAPVLYVFALEIDEEYIKFESDLLGELPNNRPSRQSAHFLQRAWGMARNRAAQYLVAALYPDPLGDYGALPAAEKLFPGPGEDLFGINLESLVVHLPDSLPELNRFIRDFAWIEGPS